ncbi:hypothetical protein, partial [Phenylobacterium sp.]|uniref:hypothetical protein n=1 Tax=Phenylobacterium sp. TaxID=1871053 RepID=UPI002600BD78
DGRNAEATIGDDGDPAARHRSASRTGAESAGDILATVEPGDMTHFGTFFIVGRAGGTPLSSYRGAGHAHYGS